MRPHRHASTAGVRRLARAALSFAIAFLLSGVAHGAGEVVEDIVVTDAADHGVHADECPAGNADGCDEHFCFGAVHTCGCCPSVLAVAWPRVIPGPPRTASIRGPLPRPDPKRDGVRERVERPPRA